jgi:hypothetical protein
MRAASGTVRYLLSVRAAILINDGLIAFNAGFELERYEIGRATE